MYNTQYEHEIRAHGQPMPAAVQLGSKRTYDEVQLKTVRLHIRSGGGGAKGSTNPAPAATWNGGSACVYVLKEQHARAFKTKICT